MATIIPYTELILGLFCLTFALHRFMTRNSVVINWPIVGMLPTLLRHQRRLHEHISTVLKRSGGTFEFRGPWFTDHHMVFTSDPANVHHMLSKRFCNYPNGEKFNAVLEPLFGDGIIAVDSDSWRFQRKMLHSYLHEGRFQLFLEKNVREKVVDGLVPVLDHVCVDGLEVNLNDVLWRLGFDITCLVFLGRDPKCLSVKSPEVPYHKALSDVEEALISRAFMPEKCWKLLKWLQIGQEKKLSIGLTIIDDFISDSISSKRIERNDHNFDFLTTYLMQDEEETVTTFRSSNKFLRDIIVNLLVAGGDTSSASLSWFFWLLSRNPEVEIKILKEIKEKLTCDTKTTFFGVNEVNKLVYLHATLCETLRLYPSVPVNPRCPMRPDTLPSGHYVKENSKIFIYFYAMGRMEAIWGKDCDEFKPERWISDDGGIRHIPSNKFTAFGAGPRSCLGKDMSFVEMKIIAATIISSYRIEVVGDQLVVPSNSMVLRMKHGLKVKVFKRIV